MSFEIRGDFKGMTERIRAGVREAAISASQACMLDGEAEAKKACPVDEGLLRASITHQVADAGDEIVGQIGTNVSYAAAVEFGTKPHFPPISALAGWVMRHKMADTEAEARSIAFLIARKHARQGTVAQPYLSPGLVAAKNGVEKYLKTFIARVK